jgi:hypothetical protein
MRFVTGLCVILLFSALALGQAVAPHGYVGYCYYGCAPYVPLITTPMLSLETVSPSPVGATNATGGLVAGATNSTLSQLSNSPSAVYTQPVWYSGGSAPLVTPAVHLLPTPIMRPEHAQHMERMEHMRHEQEKQVAWVYFTGAERTASAVEASAASKGGKHAAKTYTNDDVARQNQMNGNVKYSGKTEKIQ